MQNFIIRTFFTMPAALLFSMAVNSAAPTVCPEFNGLELHTMLSKTNASIVKGKHKWRFYPQYVFAKAHDYSYFAPGPDNRQTKMAPTKHDNDADLAIDYLKDRTKLSDRFSPYKEGKSPMAPETLKAFLRLRRYLCAYPIFNPAKADNSELVEIAIGTH